MTKSTQENQRANTMPIMPTQKFLSWLPDSLFSLPTTEERHVIDFKLLRFFFVEKNFSKEISDTYIYYLAAIRSYIIGLFLALLNVISHILDTSFDFYLFKIDAMGENFTEKFLLSYTKYTSIILVVFVLSYHLILFFKHINLKTFDVLWWSPNVNKGEKVDKARLAVSGILLLIVGVPLGLWGSFAIPAMIMSRNHYENSYVYFFLLLFFLPFLLAWLIRIYLMMIVGFMDRLNKGNDWDPKTYRNQFSKRSEDDRLP